MGIMGDSFIFLLYIFKSPSMDIYYKCNLTFFFFKSSKIHLERTRDTEEAG